MNRRSRRYVPELHKFVDTFNRYNQSFKSWAVISEHDYTARKEVPGIDEGESIICVNTSPEYTMKYMLLAFYLIFKSKRRISFIYIWSGDEKKLDYVKPIIEDMAGIYITFLREKFRMNIENRFILNYVNEMYFNRTNYLRISLREIYYQEAPDIESDYGSIASISYNIAKSIAKHGTLIASPNNSEVMKITKQKNTHMDNIIKGNLYNPPLINKQASYNQPIPISKIPRRLVSFRSEGIVQPRKKTTVYVNQDAVRPILNLNQSELQSFVSRSDIDYGQLQKFYYAIQKYYRELGIGDLIRKPANLKKETLVKYITQFMDGSIERNVFENMSDKYDFVPIYKTT